MTRRTPEQQEAWELHDEDLEVHPDDTAEVRQMKLLRLDLRADRSERAKFESRVNFRSNLALGAALITLAALVIGAIIAINVIGNKVDDLETTDARACQERAEGREGVKAGILQGDLNLIVEIGRSLGAEPDSQEVLDALERTSASGRAALDKVLPPIKC